MIADRPQTIVWAFTLNLANVDDLAVYGDLAVGRDVILNNPPERGPEGQR